MKNSILALILLSACGAPEDIDLGESQQTYLAPQRGPGTEFGYQDTDAALNCLLSQPGQTCIIPATKQIRWWVEANTGSTSADRAAVRNRVTQFIAELPGLGLAIDCTDSSKYCFSEASSLNDPLLTLLVSANGAGTGSLCPGNAANAEAYVCVKGDKTALTEDNGVVGNYVRRAIATVHIDLGDINAHGTDATQDARGVHYAVYNGMLKAMGIGGLDANNARCSSRTANFTSTCFVTNSEICELNGFTEFNDTTHYGNRQQNCGL